MPSLERDETALRDDAVMFDGRGVGNEHVVAPVQDQKRSGELREHGAERPLVRVVEAARVRETEVAALERAEVGSRHVDQAQRSELQAVDRVVELVAAEQLELLHAHGGEQHHRARAPRPFGLELESHRSSEAEPDDVHALDTEAIEQLVDVERVSGRRVVRELALRAGETRQVRDDHAGVGRQRVGESGEHLVRTGRAVQKEQHRAGEIPRRGVAIGEPQLTLAAHPRVDFVHEEARFVDRERRRERARPSPRVGGPEQREVEAQEPQRPGAPPAHRPARNARRSGAPSGVSHGGPGA